MKQTATSPSKKSDTPPPPRRRKTRSTSTTSSSSSSSISTPSPSRNYLSTPFHSTSSSVPFSWERQPGIPKIPQKTLTLTLNLPLPPLSNSRSNTFPTRKCRSDLKLSAAAAAAAAVEFDPFAAAIAECSKDSPAGPDFWRIRPASGGSDRKRWSIANRFGFLDLYGSCKTCHVEESSCRVLNRRG